MKKIIFGLVFVLLVSAGVVSAASSLATLEDYKAICSWKIGGEKNTKCELSKGQILGKSSTHPDRYLSNTRLEITWGYQTGEIEEDAIVWIKSEGLKGMEDISFSKEKEREGIDIYSYEVEGIGKVYYFCNNFKSQYDSFPDVNYTEYYNVYFDSEKEKCVYLRSDDSLDYPCDNGNTYFANGAYCESEDIAEDYREDWETCCPTSYNCSCPDSVPSCRVPSLNFPPEVVKEDFMCILYYDEEIEDKYFDTFILTDDEDEEDETDTTDNEQTQTTTQNQNTEQTQTQQTTTTTTQNKYYIKNQEVNIEQNKISVGETSVESGLEIFEVDSVIYARASSGNKEIKVLPDEAVSVADKVESVESVEISQDGESAVYVVKGTKKARLFLIFPLSADVEQSVDVETGEVVSTEKPWWSFLAFGV